MATEAEKFLTTRELARLWRVSEATVKRWADAGFLRPARTLGGHRRFALSEVARFQGERGLSGPGGVRGAAAGTRPRVDPKLAERFFAATHAGREGEAAALLLEPHLNGAPLVRILETGVARALRRVGELWHGGEFSVAEEHLATRTATRALEALRGSLRRPPPGAPQAFCCAPEEELHDTALLCVQILLEGEGWSVSNFGANTPLFALTEVLKKRAAQLVCVSSTMQTALDRNAREYGDFLAAARARGARVVLGGEGFRDEAVRRRFPADLHADNFQDLLKFLKRQV